MGLAAGKTAAHSGSRSTKGHDLPDFLPREANKRNEVQNTRVKLREEITHFPGKRLCKAVNETHLAGEEKGAGAPVRAES